MSKINLATEIVGLIEMIRMREMHLATLVQPIEWGQKAETDQMSQFNLATIISRVMNIVGMREMKM